MKLIKTQGFGLLAMVLAFSGISCSKTLIEEEAATCKTFLLGLNYECVDDTCMYTANIENKEGDDPLIMEIDKATYDHYKAKAEEKKENVCWEGVIE